MAEADRIAAALAYQEQMPAMLNPNLARQGARGRANMMPPTSIMDERYPAFKRNQEDVEKLMLGVDLVGSAIPLAGPAMKGAKVLGQHAAPQLAQALENYAFKTGMALPMDVWHGSPHRFAPTAKNPLGEFDPTKIGTGEGAQAYGMGHYLAEARGTGEEYRKALSTKIDVNGKPLYASNKTIGSTGNSDLDDYIVANLGDVSATRKHLLADIKDVRKGNPEAAKEMQKSLAELRKATINKTEGGYLYKVDLPDEVVPRMLDWDKPLSEQSNIIKNINPKNLGLTYTQLPNGNHAYVNANGEIIGNLQKGGTKEGFANNWIQATLEGTGRTLYNQLGQGMGGSEKTSKALLNAGIPGIQYLDAGSRGAGTGTRNFVVFPGNEGLLNILGRE